MKSCIFCFVIAVLGACVSYENSIFNVAKDGTAEQMEKIIHGGVDVNKSNEEGLSPLFIAVINDNSEVVPVLIEGGADINSTVNFESPLDIAIKNRNFEIIGHLVNAGIKFVPIYRNRSKQSSMSWGGDRYLDFNYMTWAIEDGDTELVKLFIDLGIDINHVVESMRETPLMRAIDKSDMVIVDMLMQAGADISVSLTNTSWSTPVQFALRGKNQEIIDKILDAGPLVDYGDLYTAIYVDTGIETLKKIITMVPDINVSGLSLGYAVERQKKEVVKLLLENGADVNGYYSMYGTTPLMIAVERADLEICELLLNAGADVHQKRQFGKGWTALYYAAQNDYSAGHEKIKLLIKAGANVNSVSDEYYDNYYYELQGGITPLMIAKGEDNISELLRAGARVNMRDSRGRTALMFNVYFNKNPQEAKLLIDSGAEINARNMQGRTPLMFAWAAYDNETLVNYLIKAGADASSPVDKSLWANYESDPDWSYWSREEYYRYQFSYKECFYQPDGK
jgi:ankyrin repeat protein